MPGEYERCSARYIFICEKKLEIVDVHYISWSMVKEVLKFFTEVFIYFIEFFITIHLIIWLNKCLGIAVAFPIYRFFKLIEFNYDFVFYRFFRYPMYFNTFYFICIWLSCMS